jgi:SAM-dependent methyltransferase
MLPILLHAHYSLYNDDLDFWCALAAQSGDPSLELGCGTGRVMLALSQAGRRVIGLDWDAAVLAFARQLSGGRLSFLRSDMRRFRLDARFALIYSPCNTYSTFTPAERRTILECAAAHLQPGGTFAFSIPNPLSLQQLPHHAPPEVEDTFRHPLDGEPVQVSAAWSRSGNRFKLEWIYDHLLPDGRIERSIAATSHDLSGPAIYRQELQEAGLKITGMYGDYDRSAFDSQESPYLILVARSGAAPTFNLPHNF